MGCIFEIIKKIFISMETKNILDQDYQTSGATIIKLINDQPRKKERVMVKIENRGHWYHYSTYVGCDLSDVILISSQFDFRK